VLVQIPAVSRSLNLRPLHGTDWALATVAFAVNSKATLGLALRLRRHLD
jgi:P-type Ca2+ transporter type 2C